LCTDASLAESPVYDVGMGAVYTCSAGGPVHAGIWISPDSLILFSKISDR